MFGMLMGLLGYTKVPLEIVQASHTIGVFLKELQEASTGEGIIVVQTYRDMNRALTDYLRSSRRLTFRPKQNK